MFEINVLPRFCSNMLTLSFLCIVGGLAVGIPGELRGMQYAHELYGKLPWKALFQPAIKLCNEGFEITQSLEIALNKWSGDVKNETCLR